MAKEIVYKLRDNTNDFRLMADGVAVDLSGVTKMELVFSHATINSIDNSEIFDWSRGDGTLILSMGAINSLSPGEKYNPSLIVYDDENEFGINWGRIKIEVR